MMQRSLALVALALLAAASPAAAPADKADVVPFNPARAEVRNLDGKWKVGDGDKWLVEFPTKEQADLALKILRFYGLNQQVWVGRPGRLVSYYLADGKAPAGPCEGEDAVAFDPAKIALERADGSWKIVEGQHYLLDFAQDEAAGKEMMGLIAKYSFTYVCYVGRPQAGMTYLRRRGDAASTVQPDVGRLRVSVFEGGKGLAAGPVITVRSVDEPDRATSALMENPALFSLKPGPYTVTAHVGTGEESAPQRIEVKAGATAEVVLGAATGTLEVALTAGGRPWARTCLIHLRRGDQLVASESASPAKFQAPAGTYLVRVAFATGQSFDVPGLAIAAGETTRKTVELPAAQVTVTVAGGAYAAGRFPYVEILKGDKMIAALSDNPAKFLLLAGDYAAAIQEGGKLIGRKDFTLQAGKDLALELQGGP